MAENNNSKVMYAVLGALALFVVVWAAMGKMVSPFTAEGFGTWFSAFLTLCILSFLYKDNPFYRFAESLFIGVSAGYVMVQGIWEMLIKNLVPKVWPTLAKSLVDGVKPVELGERLWFMVPLVLGILLIWRLAPKGGWISRWPLALIVGWASGTNLVRYLESDLTKQISPALIPLVVIQEGAIAWMPTISAFVTVLGLLAALVYFFFSVEHKGVVGATSKVGIWVLMITFGAAFGYTVMGRIALLVGRMEFLFGDWLGIIQL